MKRHNTRATRDKMRNVKCKEAQRDTKSAQDATQDATHAIEYIAGTNTPKIRVSKETRERIKRYAIFKEKYNANRRKLWYGKEERERAKYGSKNEGKRIATTRTMWHIKMETTGQLFPNTIEIPTAQRIFPDAHTEHKIAFIYTPQTHTVAILHGDITHDGDEITMKVKISGRRVATIHATIAREFYDKKHTPRYVKYKGEKIPPDTLLKAALQFHTHIYTMISAYTGRKMTQDELWQYKVATGQVKPYTPDDIQEETEEEKMRKIDEAYKKMKGEK